MEDEDDEEDEDSEEPSSKTRKIGDDGKKIVEGCRKWEYWPLGWAAHASQKCAKTFTKLALKHVTDNKEFNTSFRVATLTTI